MAFPENDPQPVTKVVCLIGVRVALCARPPFSYPVSTNNGIRNARSPERRRGVRAVMSSPQTRRADRMMSDERALETLAQGYSGRLATVSADGFPYCIPLLYLWMSGELYLHTTSARGHLRANIEREQRVCFEIDEQDGVFDYGRFECDSGLAYRSVCLFGRIRIVERQGHQAAVLRSVDGEIRQARHSSGPRASFRGSISSPCMPLRSSASPARKSRCRPCPSSGPRKTGRRRRMLRCARRSLIAGRDLRRPAEMVVCHPLRLG